MSRFLTSPFYSDVLHPNRANVSKDELRQKLAELYKANKDQVSCFGFRTQYGGGKSTGFALIYDSHEVMKKFEPHYRLVRYGAATKIEKASRQQRMYNCSSVVIWELLSPGSGSLAKSEGIDRQTTQEPSQDCAGDSQGQSRDIEGQEEVGHTGCLLDRARWEERGATYLCVLTSCSRILWRIGNAKFSSDLLMSLIAKLL